ncbi:hypothetical protein MP228_006098 [Amoeboaphelidium protococcarum]|nr:hypothetical protein MP228_006098 [Amoeboaphelidium protococcarum]
MGPTFIKLGQWAATRPDLFSKEVCYTLTELHDNVGSSFRHKKDENKYLERVFRTQFGVSTSDIFDDVTEQCELIGSGCIASVYKMKLSQDAILKLRLSHPDADRLWPDEENRGIVAVKVRHPHIARIINLDLQLMNFAALLIDALPIKNIEYLSITEEVQMFERFMMEQVDLRHEAENLRTFRRNFYSDQADEKRLKDRDRNQDLVSDNSFPDNGQDSDSIFSWKKWKENTIDMALNIGSQIGSATGAMDCTQVSFPSVIEQYVAEDVLTETFADGIPIKAFIYGDSDEGDSQKNEDLLQSEDDHQARTTRKQLNRSVELVKKKIANVGLLAFLKMMLDDNFIHSDLHPGNIIVQLFNSEGQQYSPSMQSSLPMQSAVAKHELNRLRVQEAIQNGYTKPRLIFIDAGLTTTLDDTNLNNFLDLFSALADGDGALAARLMVERSRIPERQLRRRPELRDLQHLHLELILEAKCSDFPGFRQKMSQLVSDVQLQTFRLGNISISELLTQVLDMVRNHHVKIESDFTNLVVSLMIIEGLGRSLDPDLDLFASARPFLLNRKAAFYAQKGGLMLKLAAYVEARFWLLSKQWSEEEYGPIDILMYSF